MRAALLLGAAAAAQQQCTQRCRNECNACILSYAIIGARKAGTTSLYRWISAHPDAVGYGLNRGPRAGEVMYFSSDKLFPVKPVACFGNTCQQGRACVNNVCQPPHQWYNHQFPCVSGRKVAGEASVAYLVHAEAPRRMFEYCSTALPKIIALLREPIARYESQFQMRVRLKTRGYTSRSAADADMRRDVHAFCGVTKNHATWFLHPKPTGLFEPARNGVYEGVYVAHLKRWRHAGFSVHTLFFEEFFSDERQADHLRDVLRYIGLDPTKQDAHATSKRKYNTKGSDFDYFPRHALSSFAQRRLAVLFRPYNDGLASFLGRPLPDAWARWPNATGDACDEAAWPRRPGW